MDAPALQHPSLLVTIEKLQQLTRRQDLDFSHWVQSLLHIAIWQFDADSACLSRIDEKELSVVECVSKGGKSQVEAGDSMALDRTFCSVTAAMQTPLMAPDTRRHKMLAEHPAVNQLPSAYWGVALYFGGVLWGTLSIASAANANTLGDENSLLLLAGLVELKLENEEYREELAGARESYKAISERLNNLQHIDPLTALPSRGASFDYLHRELNQLIRRDGEGAIALVDVDGLHLFNQKFGHQEGDRVLKGVAVSLRQAIRNYDYVARYDGAQFLVWFPDTLQSEVLKVCERMAEKTALCEVAGAPVTLSIGYCAFRSDSEEHIPYTRALDALINLAHKALKEAKAHGQNCVVSASRWPVTITSVM